MRRSFSLFVLARSALGCSSKSNESSSGSDASTDSGLFVCSASLAAACETLINGCPPPSTANLPGPWCASQTTVSALSGSCGGYNVMTDVTEDGVLLFLYALDGGTFSGVMAAPAGGLPICIGGASDFALPTSCFIGGANLTAFTGPGAGPGCGGGEDGGGVGDDGGVVSDADVDGG
jgi:hypothetical protein